MTSETPTPEKEESSPKQLTPAQWAEVVMLWELGEVKLEELSTRFGISISGLSKGLKARGVTRGSRAHEVAAAVKKTVLAAREDDALTDEQERQRKIKDTRTQHYDWAKGLATQVMAAFARAQKAGDPFSSELANIKTLRQGLAALEVARRERFAVLNADEDMGDGELPTLPIQDLSEAEIAILQKADGDDAEILLEDDDIVETTA